jgi:hypothetical protein
MRKNRVQWNVAINITVLRNLLKSSSCFRFCSVNYQIQYWESNRWRYLKKNRILNFLMWGLDKNLTRITKADHAWNWPYPIHHLASYCRQSIYLHQRRRKTKR